MIYNTHLPYGYRIAHLDTGGASESSSTLSMNVTTPMTKSNFRNSFSKPPLQPTLDFSLRVDQSNILTLPSSGRTSPTAHTTSCWTKSRSTPVEKSRSSSGMNSSVYDCRSRSRVPLYPMERIGLEISSSSVSVTILIPSSFFLPSSSATLIRCSTHSTDN